MPEATIDFLAAPSHERLRREIRNICDSYSHPWDILAELTQNAVDAIRLWRRHNGERRHHEIAISINQRTRTLEIRDSGVGFDPDKFIELLAPHGTNKRADDIGVIGQKGVGLTYTIFACNRFYLKSKSTSGLVEGRISGAADWKDGRTETPPVFEVLSLERGPVDPKETFTQIILEDVEDKYGEGDILALSAPVVEFLLRTRTAIGCTSGVFDAGAADDIEVSFTMRPLDGDPTTRPIKFKYLTPGSSSGPAETWLTSMTSIGAPVD